MAAPNIPHKASSSRSQVAGHHPPGLCPPHPKRWGCRRGHFRRCGQRGLL